MLVKIINSSVAYENLWKKFGHEVVSDIQDADIVQFTGGEDVTSQYYGHPKHPTSFTSPARDFLEKQYFEKCIELDIPMVGICRGGQFLNVMSGGKMYQHVSGHGMDHPIHDLKSGRKILASSTHHQIMVHPNECVEIVAVSEHPINVVAYSDMQRRFVEMRINQSMEVLYYPLTRSLCFQPHPEFESKEMFPLQEYYFELINHYVGETV